jgi:hypothetical protein
LLVAAEVCGTRVSHNERVQRYGKVIMARDGIKHLVMLKNRWKAGEKRKLASKK